MSQAMTPRSGAIFNLLQITELCFTGDARGVPRETVEQLQPLAEQLESLHNRLAAIFRWQLIQRRCEAPQNFLAAIDTHWSCIEEDMFHATEAYVPAKDGSSLFDMMQLPQLNLIGNALNDELRRQRRGRS